MTAMSREEVFQATKKVFGLYGAFFGAVAQEMGIEKALTLHMRAHEALGVKAGKGFVEAVGRQDAASTNLRSSCARATSASGLTRS
jgi:hypothetical protein